MLVTLLFISIFMFGMVFGVIIIPNIVHLTKRIALKNSDWVDVLQQRSTKRMSKKIRRSEIFKNRLDSILKTISEHNKDGTSLNYIIVTSMRNCDTDREIRKILQERKFDINFEYNAKNTLRIGWRNG